MEFNCDDVLEVQGSRYVVTEKIKYMEIIPKQAEEQAYKGPPSMTKPSGDYWHEYGLKAVAGKDKIWLTIEYNDDEWCTVSRTTYHTSPKEGFSLHQIGLEKVMSVDGDSGATTGDRAGYKEYQMPNEDGARVFFVEDWFQGAKMYAEGNRVRLVNIKLCKDAAADAISAKIRNTRLKKHIRSIAIALGCGLSFLFFLIGSEEGFSWHAIRNVFGFPYTAKERMHDTALYYTKVDSDTENVYISRLDPVTTALDLFEAIGGAITSEGEDLQEGREIIVFYSRDSVYIITNTDGQTRVKVCEPSKLTPDEIKLIDRTMRKSHILDSYAYMIRQRDGRGRDSLFRTGKPNI